MDGPEYFTPPMADMAAQTQPGLWDGIDLSEFNAARATLIDRMQPADRMLLMLSRKDLTPTARIVGAALAYHGWVSWPSLDTLADLLNIDKRHLSRPVHDLVDHGYARRSKRSGARGSVSTQYVFSGLAILNALDSDEAGELSKRVRIARGRDHQNGDGGRVGQLRDHQNGGDNPTRYHQNGDGSRLRDHQNGDQTGILTGIEEEEEISSSSSSSRSFLFGHQNGDGNPTRDHQNGDGGRVSDQHIMAALEEFRGYLGAWKSEGAAVRFYADNPGRFAIDLADAQRRKASTEQERHGEEAQRDRYLSEYERRRGHLPWEETSQPERH